MSVKCRPINVTSKYIMEWTILHDSLFTLLLASTITTYLELLLRWYLNLCGQRILDISCTRLLMPSIHQTALTQALCPKDVLLWSFTNLLGNLQFWMRNIALVVQLLVGC